MGLKELSDLPDIDSQPSLIVLDSLDRLSFDENSLFKTLQRTSVHVVVLSKNSASLDLLQKEIDQKLLRGTTVVDVHPLTPIHAIQRLVHAVLKESNLTPSTEVQTAFEKIASFASGSPAIIDVIASLLQSYLEQAKCSIEQALQDFATFLTTEKVSKSPPELRDLQNELICIAHKWESIATFMLLDDRIGRIAANYDTVERRLLKTLRVWKNTCRVPFTWDNIIACLRSKALDDQKLANKIESSRHVNEKKDFVTVLMAYCSSNELTCLKLLDYLSVFRGCPVPVIFTKEIATVISKNPVLASNMCSTLRSMKLLKPYPRKFIYYPNPSLLMQLPKETDFEYVPEHIAELVWNKVEVDRGKVSAIRKSISPYRSQSLSSLPTSYKDTLYERML